MIQSNSVQNQEQIAVPKKRVGAFVIDDLVVSFLFLAIFWSQLASLRTVEEVNLFLTENFLIIVTIKILYHTLFVWQSGMTLGKYMMKIKVVTQQTGDIPKLHIALSRASLRIVSETFFYLGFAMAFFNPMVQTLHDKLTGCVVIDA
ncbi:MAG TPA: RDD family protein [Epsilonproteobacteria bacterium]|nr:RDD family protein [Campylobacterota bacterium]